MKASVLDLRHNMKDVLRALERNEPVKVFYHGKEQGVIFSSKSVGKQHVKVSEHRAFGMWRDDVRKKDVKSYVRRLRESRHAV